MDERFAREAFTEAVCTELTERRYAKRVADAEAGKCDPVAHAPSWKAKVLREMRMKHGVALGQMDPDLDPVAVADQIEPAARPPKVDAREATAVAAQAAYGRADAQYAHPCVFCDATGWVVNVAGDAFQCPGCQGSGVDNECQAQTI